MTNTTALTLQEYGKQALSAQTEYKEKLAALRARLPKEKVKDYELVGNDGKALKLSSLFGDKEHLILVHNMGFSCPYCTMWGDGFRSLYTYVEQRAAFVVASPDNPTAQLAGKAKRGWDFPMVSYGTSTLCADMGFQMMHEGKASYMPGYSVFHKSADGSVTRVGWDMFGPGDEYCSVFGFFTFLPPFAEGEWFNPDSNAALPKQHAKTSR